MLKNTLLLLSAAFLTSTLLGCANGNCRTQANYKKETQKDIAVPSSSLEKVKVYKEDGSLQCGMGKAVTLVEMQKQLGSIKVYSSFTKNDGQMRIQVCGAPTGNCNVYEIDRAQLSEALKSGFKEWIYE